MRAKWRELAPEDITSLVALCSPVLRSSVVAEAFAKTLGRILSDVEHQRACAAAGVIPAVVSLMSAHSAVSVVIAQHGCKALGRLAADDTPNADAIVLTSGGLGLLCAAMETHAGSESVQEEASCAMWVIAKHAGSEALAVMRAGSAVQLLQTARTNFPSDGDFGDYRVKHYADRALAILAPQ